MEDYGSRSGGTAADGVTISARQLKSIEEVAEGFLKERRRTRRWSIFFRIMGLLLAVFVVLLIAGRSGMSGSTQATGKHTALVELQGAIDVGGETNADSINTALQAAFKDENTAGVILRINSPGGSPVQSGIIHDEIKRLRAKYPDIPLYVVVEEICASGGYYVAAAADRIYVDKASLIGSIGVLMDGFGFVGTMEKLGVERRLITAGQNKGFLDSFSPLSEPQKQFAQTMVAEIHQQFIDVVKKGRGARLKDSPEVFSGLIWTGARGVEMGLADALGTVEMVARDVVKAEDIVDFSTRENVVERLAKKIGASAGEVIAKSLRASGEVPKLR